MQRNSLPRSVTAMLLCCAVLAACSSAPVKRPTPDANIPVVPTSVVSIGDRIADSALAQKGLPYRFGGSGPDAFDCSGLVHFAHAAVGIDTPRTTAEQLQAARVIPAADLQRGDLLFFRIEGQRVSHVGIFVGDDRFIHAPQTGRPVETRSMGDAYFAPRLVSVGRLH
jgi:murein DD-endopeptidase